MKRLKHPTLDVYRTVEEQFLAAHVAAGWIDESEKAEKPTDEAKTTRKVARPKADNGNPSTGDSEDN